MHFKPVNSTSRYLSHDGKKPSILKNGFYMIGDIYVSIYTYIYINTHTHIHTFDY